MLLVGRVVGHEDDVSLVDLVADKRASTPSNAAEIIFPDSKDLFKLVESLKLKADIAMQSRLRFIEMELVNLKEDLSRSFNNLIYGLEAKLNVAKARLSSLDFEKLFAKGFAYLEHNGKSVISVKDVRPGDMILARLVDGELELEVK
jgi:exodeoxyribonuclease VII large subunit